ncbi:MAG: gamma-glutamyltransferase [Ahrensia sp.]|nr:gamma-glutamyltransferase [Ahrensia sp.]
MFRRLSLIAASFALLFATGYAQQATDEVAPESGTTQQQAPADDGVVAPKPGARIASPNLRPAIKAQKWMVTVANPLAAQAAADVLKGGGNAVDAAVAAQAMLGLVEPQSSGLGGGAFLVYFDAKAGRLTTLDGRETAPAAATPTLFQDDNGEPLEFFDAVIGGRSVGVPGTPALMVEMHRRWGSRKFGDLLQPAIDQARRGFVVSPRLAALTERSAEFLAKQKEAADYFLPGGLPVDAGRLQVNLDYAETLSRLGNDLGRSFYEGGDATAIVSTIKGFAANPGVMEMADLANYSVKEREPVCIAYRVYDVCGMGPPSSGALTVGQILGLIEPFDIAALGPNDVDSWRLIGDASRLAFADRSRYMADSDFVPMPTKGLMKDDYLAERARMLESDRALTKEQVAPGSPSWDHATLLADDESLELPSTSHFSIIDEAGNAVSMTTTIENAFGSRLMVNGFLLNNELTDFSFRSHRDGVPIANRVEPGKRPRSSMSPTIVMKDGKPVLLIGSPGGSRIIGYVAKTIIAHLDWGMNIRAAIELPHLVNRFGTYDLEAGTDAESMKAVLENIGYEVNIRDLNSGLHGISIYEDGLQGGADPRREGVVIAE